MLFSLQPRFMPYTIKGRRTVDPYSTGTRLIAQVFWLCLHGIPPSQDIVQPILPRTALAPKQAFSESLRDLLPEAESSSRCSEKPFTSTYPEPDETRSHPHAKLPLQSTIQSMPTCFN